MENKEIYEKSKEALKMLDKDIITEDEVVFLISTLQDISNEMKKRDSIPDEIGAKIIQFPFIHKMLTIV